MATDDYLSEQVLARLIEKTKSEVWSILFGPERGQFEVYDDDDDHIITIKCEVSGELSRVENEYSSAEEFSVDWIKFRILEVDSDPELSESRLKHLRDVLCEEVTEYLNY